jgi:hypothetical protein
MFGSLRINMKSLLFLNSRVFTNFVKKNFFFLIRKIGGLPYIRGKLIFGMIW